jgi:pimeloyl-ACP methyl ester carboxylesterase
MKWPKFRGFGGLSKRMPKETSDSFALPLSTSAGLRRDYGKFLRAISPKLTLEAAIHFNNFNKPVLIAWSHEDQFFPKAHANRLHQQFHDSKLVFIEDSYTFSAIDNPTQLTNEIRIFLQGT